MGLILVFDMDQTILDSSDPYLFNRPPTPEAREILKQRIREGLNWNVVNLLKRAANLRPGGVDAICLLTNNSSTILVSAVDEVLYEETGLRGKYKTYKGNANDRTMPNKHYFFDSIMMRQHSSRPKTPDNNPPKRFIDIVNMMKFMGLGNIGVERMKDVYFFDDIGTHDLRAEFNFISQGKYKDHYIHITPPYSSFLLDETDYTPILNALHKIDTQQPNLPEPPPPNAPASKLEKTYRPRSNTLVNANNLNLPPPPQEQSIKKKPNLARKSLFGAFTPPKGGSRRTRRRKLKRCRLSRRK